MELSMSLEHSPIRELGAASYKLAYTIPEAVRASGLSRSALYLAIKAKKLTARKAGARTVIEVSELRRFITSLPTLGA
jgi:hypothetical protein